RGQAAGGAGLGGGADPLGGGGDRGGGGGGGGGAAPRGGRDRRALLDVAWRTLVECQFHDAIGGCASDDVARAVEARLTEVEALARGIVRGSVFGLVGHDPDRAGEGAAGARA